MLVSVIIPFYKGVKWLEEAVDSVLAQSFTDYEIIIVDDGSPENVSSSHIDLEDPSIFYFRKENGGAASARNFGIQHARGKYIAFLDADDRWRSDKLEKQILYMEENHAKWCNSCYAFFYPDGVEQLQDNTFLEGDIFPLPLLSINIATPSIVVERALLLENGLHFPEGVELGEDCQLWTELSRLVPIHTIPEPLVFVRMRGDNSALDAGNHLKNRSYLWKFIKERNFQKDISPLAVFGYQLCRAGHAIYKRAPGGKSRAKTLLGKALYALPWCIFKFEKNRCIRRNIKNDHA